MKKLAVLLLCVFLLCSCTPKSEHQPTAQREFCGMYMSYIELLEMSISPDFKECFNKAIKDCESMGITDIFVHVRAMCDSIYPSAYYPLTDWAKNLDFDVLGFIIESCHKSNIRFHAWINPYRISSYTNDLEKISPESPAHSLSHCIGDTENGLYFDPSREEVRKLIIDSIRELLTRYSVDGIHFDDYFYPTTSAYFDLAAYNAYCSQTVNPLSLDNWRRANVNSLISGVRTAIYNSDKPILFSISPGADIDNNENRLYADIHYWCQTGFIDAVIPQLYFGFEYPLDEFKFDNLLTHWIEYLSGTDTLLYIALAPYKLDTDQNPDSIEWKDGVDIISKQISLLKRNPFVDGFALYSYSFLFGKGENIEKQKNNIIKTIKEENL